MYRCGHLAHVTDKDFDYAMGLDFAVAADLRQAGERGRELSPWPLAHADRNDLLQD